MTSEQSPNVSRGLALRVFHKYKDPLQKLSPEELPKEKLVEPGDFKILLQVLQGHPNASKKIGNGVKQVVVRRWMHGREDMCCCIAQRVDNTEEDFSLLRCFGNRSWENHRLVKNYN